MRHILLALMFVAVTAGPLYAQPGPGDGPHGRGARGDRPDLREQMEKLNLNDEQKDAMHDIRVSTKTRMIDIRADLQKKRLALAEIMRADAPDRAAYEQTAREISDLQLKQKMLLFDSRQEVMNVLTPEQQEEFRQMAEKRRMERPERMMDRERGPRGRR